MATQKRLIKIYLDPIANTLNIWWDDPKKAFIAEEVDSPHRNDVVVKDRYGCPISLEVIGVFPSELNIAKRFKSLVTSTKEPVLLEAKPVVS